MSCLEGSGAALDRMMRQVPTGGGARESVPPTLMAMARDRAAIEAQAVALAADMRTRGQLLPHRRTRRAQGARVVGASTRAGSIVATP